MSKPSWLIALENKWIKNGKDTSPVLTEFNFTKFWNEYGYPYLNGAAHTGFTPVGTVISVMSNEAPDNYLVCDGTVYNISKYSDLANFFEDQFGSKNYFGGDGTTTFAVPDLRGEFLRGAGTNGHANQGNGGNVGEHQDATEFNKIQGHNGQIFATNGAPINWDAEISVGTYSVSNAGSTASSELWNRYSTRPTNTSVLYCIAYKNIYIDAVIGGENTEITDPQEGQGLVYDATNGVWKNGAGGLHEYSTTEKVIGKWIDGRPVYEITLNLTDSDFVKYSNYLQFSIASYIGNNSDNLIDIQGIVRSNISNFTKYGAMSVNGGGFDTDPKLYFINYFNNLVLVYIKNGSQVDAANYRTEIGIQWARVTIKYVKSSDLSS